MILKYIFVFSLMVCLPLYVNTPEYNYYKTKSAVPSEEEILDYLSQASLEYGIDYNLALRIAMAESSLNPFAINYNTNGSNDKGLFQINSVHNIEDSCRMDYRCNIDWAMETMSTAGTTPWYSSEHRWKGGEYD